MNEPYLDVYGEPTSGSMPMNQEKLSAIALLAAGYNLRLQFPFAGDAAAEMILTAIEAANEHTSIVSRRWLTPHFQHPTHDHVLRTRRLGLRVTGYTAVDYSKGAAVYVARWRVWTSSARAKRCVPSFWTDGHSRYGRATSLTRSSTKSSSHDSYFRKMLLGMYPVMT